LASDAVEFVAYSPGVELGGLAAGVRFEQSRERFGHASGRAVEGPAERSEQHACAHGEVGARGGPCASPNGIGIVVATSVIGGDQGFAHGNGARPTDERDAMIPRVDERMLG